MHSWSNLLLSRAPQLRDKKFVFCSCYCHFQRRTHRCGLCSCVHETYISLTLQSCQSLVRGWTGLESLAQTRLQCARSGHGSLALVRQALHQSLLGVRPTNTTWLSVCELQNLPMPRPSRCTQCLYGGERMGSCTTGWRQRQTQRCARVGSSCESGDLAGTRVGGCSCRGNCASSRCCQPLRCAAPHSLLKTRLARRTEKPSSRSLILLMWHRCSWCITQKMDSFWIGFCPECVIIIKWRVLPRRFSRAFRRSVVSVVSVVCGGEVQRHPVRRLRGTVALLHSLRTKAHVLRQPLLALMSSTLC